MRARDVLRTSIREGTHLTANEYVAILFFDGNVLTVSEIFWTDIIGSSFLSLSTVDSPQRICRLGTAFYLGYFAFQVPQNLGIQRFPVGKWIRQVSQYIPPILVPDRRFGIVSTLQCGELHSVIMRPPRTSLVC